MILLSPEQLYEKIQEGDIKYITWYEGYVPNPKELRQMFHRFRAESPAEVLADAQKILGRYSGQFTVSMLPTDKGTAIPPIVVRVQANGGTNMAMNGTPGGQQQLSYDQLYQKVLDDVKKEMETQRLKMEIESLKNQLNGIQGQGDKLAYVGMKIVEGFLAKNNPKLKQAIQGFTEAEEVKTDTNMDEKKAPEPPKDKAKLAAAFDKLYALMGEDLLITVADKLEASPDKVQLIKTFL